MPSLHQTPTEDLIRSYAQVNPGTRALVQELFARLGGQGFTGLTLAVDALNEKQYGDG